MLKRLYIEDDPLELTHYEYDRAKNLVGKFFPDKDKPNVFDTTIFDAMLDGDVVFEAIKNHDQIFCSTSSKRIL